MTTFQTNKPRKKFTGRKILVLADKMSTAKFMNVSKKSSLRLASSRDFKKKESFSIQKILKEADGVYLDKLKIAVLNQNKEKLKSFSASSVVTEGMQYMEDERYVYKSSKLQMMSYLKGYKDAIDNLFEKFSSQDLGYGDLPGIGSRDVVLTTADEDKSTWGIKATGVLDTELTGKGVKVAILDTGIYEDHPYFSGKGFTAKSFFDNLEVNDIDGHGTHCSGVATGNTTEQGQRYGVAPDAELFVGKVLDNNGEGTDGSLLGGIEWAIENKCHIISMSLGAIVGENDPFSQTYERVAKRALDAGSLIIAASGNESNRTSGSIAVTNHPANCPSIMAVGAVDEKLKMAYFSNGSSNFSGGEIDLVGPGVNIFSTYKKPENYYTDSGTSMATPFVSGIAALYKEKHPDITAIDLWKLLLRNAKKIKADAKDGGAGLVFIK